MRFDGASSKSEQHLLWPFAVDDRDDLCVVNERNLHAIADEIMSTQQYTNRKYSVKIYEEND